MDFGEKLYNLRIKAGYSQEDLSDKLQVSRQAVSKWELGTTLPNTDKLIAIGELFNVSLDYLIKDSCELNVGENFDRLVLQFLGYAQDMDGISKELVGIVKDGVIDSDEKSRMDAIVETLDNIAQIINEIKNKIEL